MQTTSYDLDCLQQIGSADDAARYAAAIAENAAFTQLATFVTPEDRTYWCMMAPVERPSFTLALLADFRGVQAQIGPMFAHCGAHRPFDYFVFGSSTPGVFNLGGDLVLFRREIEEGRADALRAYGRACVDVMFAHHVGYGLPIVTIALVQGDALGGGFEAALGCDMIVAERQAKFGFPEILFNLFPGMGAYTYLSRRIGAQRTEAMIRSGRVYTAVELHEMGVVDVLADEGDGENEVRRYVAANRSRHNAHAALCRVRRRVDTVTLAELHDIVDIWTDAAMTLGPQDLRRMTRLANAQDRAAIRRVNTAMAAAE